MSVGPRRILHLLASPAWSGPAENVALLAAAQRELGHEVAIAVDRKRARPANEEPIVPRLRELELLDGPGLELSVKSTPLAMLRDVAALKARALDVVHAHFTHDHLIARFGTPRGAVLIRSVHAPRSLRRSLPRADGFTVPTQELAEALGPRRHRVLGPAVAPSFVPAPDRSALRSALGIDGAPLIGMVSNLQPSRRHALGLEAFSILAGQAPQARLVIVGEGPLEASLRARAAEPGLEGRVHFAGYREGAGFVRWLQALDEVWILGLGNDWSGRAAAQARACGVRVVAVAEGGLPPLADAVVRDLTPSELVAASRAGGRSAVPLPDNRALAEQVLALYAEALGDRGARP